jgi:hypothetical protein
VSKTDQVPTRADVTRAWRIADDAAFDARHPSGDRVTRRARRKAVDSKIARAQAMQDAFDAANPDKPWTPGVGGGFGIKGR